MRARKTAVVLAGIAVAALAAASSASAVVPVFTVNTSDDHAPNGCAQPPAGDCTLREAIQAAQAAGVESSIPIVATGKLTLTSSLPTLPGNKLTIAGPGANAFIVDGSDNFSIFKVPLGPSDVISGMTLTRGIAADGGGALDVVGTLTATGVAITHGSTPNDGGGVYVESSGGLAMVNSTVSDNHADGSGGGIHNQGELILDTSTVAHNTADANAGGIESDNATSGTTINSSTITENTAGAGGANGDGGGIAKLNAGAAVNFSNTIIAGNHDVEQTNSYNAPDCGPPAYLIIQNAHNIVGNPNDCNLDEPAMTGNPLLGSLGDNGGPTQTVPIAAGSIAIDHATTDVGLGGPPQCRPTDQRGLPRNGVCDIGAFEVQPAPPAAAAAAAAATPIAVKKCKRKKRHALAAKKKCRKKKK